MPDLKLARLPDRTPVKISFKASPDLSQMLNEYCGVYRAVYRQPDETVEELIPFMLAAFMEADPQFKKARKQMLGSDVASKSETSAQRLSQKSGRRAVPTAAATEPTKEHN